MRYELVPTGNRKSFYKKAYVIMLEDGTRRLQSYKTNIMEIKPDGEMVRLWNGWTATTGNHIASFSGLNKKEFMTLPLAS